MENKANLFEFVLTDEGGLTPNDKCQLCGKLVNRDHRVHHAKVHIAKGEAVKGPYKRIRRNYYIVSK